LKITYEVQFKQHQRLLRQVTIVFEGEPSPQRASGGEGSHGDGSNIQLIPGQRRDQVPQSLLARLSSNDPRIAITHRNTGEIFSDLIHASPLEASLASNRAVRDLLYIGRDAVAFLVAGLNSTNFRVRAVSQRVLGTYLDSPRSHEAAEALIAALLDPSSGDELRRRAQTLLREAGGISPAPLLNGLNSNEPVVRMRTNPCAISLRRSSNASIVMVMTQSNLAKRYHSSIRKTA